MEYNGTRVKSRTCSDEGGVSCVSTNTENIIENDEFLIEECYGNDTCGCKRYTLFFPVENSQAFWQNKQ